MASVHERVHERRRGERSKKEILPKRFEESKEEMVKVMRQTESEDGRQRGIGRDNVMLGFFMST